jgi:hypothetical protein
VSRRLIVINVALGIVSVVLAVGIVRTLLAKRPLPPPPASKAVSAPAPAVPAAAGDVGPGAYGVIAARTLFNPSRSETAAAVVVAAAPVAKPILHGVVVDGAKSRAFLEDPAFKRVAGYSVGDTVGGGTIQKISDDRVVIVRPEGLLEILLQDPSKPRAAPAPTAAQAGPTAVGPMPARPAQAGPMQAGPMQAGPTAVGPTPARPAQAVPTPAVPTWVGPTGVGPAQVGSPPNPGPPGILRGRRQHIPGQRLPDGDSE